MSLNPRLILSGTPLTSQSLNFHPAVYPSLSSTITLKPTLFSSTNSFLDSSITISRSLFLKIGTITN